MPFSMRRWRVTAIVASAIILALYHLINSADHLPSHSISAQKDNDIEPGPDGKVHWRKLPDQHPVRTLIPLPTGTPAYIPPVQASPALETQGQKTERLRRLAAVKESFIHSWNGYKKEAWLRDEVSPVTGGYKDSFGGWAATLVDSLDSLWIMGMTDEFELAVAALDQIDFTTTESSRLNIFETTIRYLGGFLAAYDISDGRYPVLLEKAIEVGELCMCVFDTPNRLPITRWDWKAYVKGKFQEAPRTMLVSEIGSLSLEFTRLAQLTGDSKYYDAIQRVADKFEASQMKTKLPGMWPVVVDAQRGSFVGDNTFTLGGMSDSLYEYLPKQFLLLGGLLAQPRTLYENFIEVAKEHLFFRPLNPDNLDLLISGDVRINMGTPKESSIHRGQHLTCFAGGMVALGARIFDRPDEMETAVQLTNGCVWAYDSQPSGIGPEIFGFAPCPRRGSCAWSDEKWHNAILGISNEKEEEEGSHARAKAKREPTPLPTPPPPEPEDVLERIASRRVAPGFTTIDDRRYILRPEAIESVFVMYRVTGDRAWQEKAWRMFEAVERVSRTKIAASAVNDVTLPADEMRQENSMESFWLAETLKYFYLCFAEVDVMSLDEFVLNTEAHPLRRPV